MFIPQVAASKKGWHQISQPLSVRAAMADGKGRNTKKGWKVIHDPTQSQLNCTVQTHALAEASNFLCCVAETNSRRMGMKGCKNGELIVKDAGTAPQRHS